MKRIDSRAPKVALIVAILGMPLQAAAEEGTATYASGELARAIGQQLDEEAARERLWWRSWTLVSGGLTVGQGLAAATSRDRDTRADQGVGAATSFLGVVGMLFSPLPEVDAAAKTLRDLPSDTAEQRHARDEAALMLRDSAANAERQGRSWLSHAVNFALAAGSSIILWKGFDRGAASAANFGISLAVGELQIWTQPAGLIGASVPREGAAGSTMPESTAWYRSLRVSLGNRRAEVALTF
jgi:hypothetical protein